MQTESTSRIKLWRPTGSVASRIRRMVALAATLSVLAVSLVATITVYFNERAELLAATHARTELRLPLAAGAAASNNPLAAEEAVRLLSQETGAVSVEIRDVDGHVVASRTSSPPADGAPAQIGAATARLWNAIVGSYSFTLPLELEGAPVGMLDIVVPSTAVRDSLDSLVWMMIAAMLVAVAVSILVTARMRQFVTRPLNRLLTAMESVSRRQQYDLHVDPDGPDEIGSLINSFNEMLAQVNVRDQHLAEHRRQLQEQVIERTRKLAEVADAAEHSSRAKGDFLARMSHEIRTPMNGVVGMAELLDNTQLDERQRRMLKTMRSSAEALLEIINDILDFSKIEAGRLQVVSEEFGIRELVEEVCELLSSKAHGRGLELVCEIGRGVPHAAKGDALRLRQVLINLIGNAVKYTEQGQIVVRVVAEGQDELQLNLRFEVEDTGLGIPADQIDSVFEAFTQVGSFETRKHGGTGLGLAITRQLVVLMGGEVGVRSDLGKGSTFWVRLPLAQSKAAPQAQDWSALDLRMLLVEPNEASRTMVTRELEAAGAAVIAVGTATRAREQLILGSRFDLVLLSQDVPDKAFEFLQSLRSNASLAALPVVMMTRLDLSSNPAADAPCEPDEWLPKPIRQARLHEAIDRAVGRLSRDHKSAEGTSTLRALGMRVLLVEDSPVNTEVALGMLESLGCTVVTAINGQSGVEHALGERFDVVLMDCQMPLMDGYEATRTIREGEAERGRAPVPIVAITANALPGDRERCLDAGMTDFISKPFTIRKLATVLRAVAEPGSILPEGGAAPQVDARPASSLPVIEIGQIEELRSLGRPQLVRKTILMFLKQAAEKLSTLDAALESGDMQAVEQAAHSLKSAALNVGGRRFAATAGNCETVARQRDPAEVRKAVKPLRPEFSRLCQALSSLLEAEPEGKVA